MIYIRDKLSSNFPDGPVYVFCELNELLYEVRKVHLHSHGSIFWTDSYVGEEIYADVKEVLFSDFRLADQPYSHLETLIEDQNIEFTEITKEEFEEIWMRAKRQSVV